MSAHITQEVLSRIYSLVQQPLNDISSNEVTACVWMLCGGEDIAVCFYISRLVLSFHTCSAFIWWRCTAVCEREIDHPSQLLELCVAF